MVVVLIGVVGSLIGKSVNARMNQQLFKRVFAVFLILLGGFVIVNEGSKLALPSSGQASASSTTEVQPHTSEASLETQLKRR
ncbi:hypothetical protein [Symmachiella dynata]|uniref:hypothetical protein n=1 Tax=Symmachiella dynata TaxID=2527995 RepID=UPI0030EE7DB0|tara:strand:- start:691 stop:936 length:246 start_codon:yes stop_codon:yes gene_type:complete